MIRASFGLLLALFIVAASVAAPACNSTQCVTTTAVVATANPVVTVASPVVATAQVLVPVYGSQYLPSGVQQQTASDEVLLQILQELRAMRSELQALKQPAVLPIALANASQTLSKSCVKCHGASAAERDGGGFAMFNDAGGLLQLADRDKQRIAARVSRNSMPPAPAKLSAADKKLIVDAFQGK